MKVLLGVTGSVAATLTDKIVAALEQEGHTVKVVCTFPATYFWRKGFWRYLQSALYNKLVPRALRCYPMARKYLTDFDEWRGCHYRKDDVVLHIALRDWADAFVIAPLTANTLAKLAHGLCDNLLTSVARSWLPSKPLILAPAMNTQMWAHPATLKHLTRVGTTGSNQVIVVAPQSKKLACGDVGVGALAKVEDIVQALQVKD